MIFSDSKMYVQFCWRNRTQFTILVKQFVFFGAQAEHFLPFFGLSYLTAMFVNMGYTILRHRITSRNVLLAR